MSDTPPDYTQMFAFMSRLDKRITALEQDALYIDKLITKTKNKYTDDYIDLNEELRRVESSITKIRDALKDCVFEMLNTSRMLKTAVKKDDLELVNNQLDEIKFESYVTRIDLEKGL